MERKIVVGYIPKLLYKVYLYLKDKFDPKPPITDEEQICSEICTKLISREDSRLTYAPLSKKRFIKNDELQIFIVIDSRGINIINHIYSYYIYIENDFIFNELMSVFDHELETRRQKLESEIVSNIQHSLKSILKKLD